MTTGDTPPAFNQVVDNVLVAEAGANPGGGRGAPPILDEIEEGITKKKLGLGAWLAIGWMVLLVGASILAPVLPLKDPAAAATPIPKLAPGQGGLLLGADNNGRDMLSRLVWGTRTSLLVSFASIAVGFVIGGLLGLYAGFYRNWIGKVLASLFDILLAIPALVLALSLVAVLKGDPIESNALPGEVILIIALGLVSIPLLARITRANTLAWGQREFVTAAKAQGATSGRILFREILPNVLPAMGYIALLGVGIAIVAEGGLALLGASVNPPQPTLGTMIDSGRADMGDAPFLIFEPILCIFFTVMALNYLGDVVRERFDVRESAL